MAASFMTRRNNLHAGVTCQNDLFAKLRRIGAKPISQLGIIEYLTLIDNVEGLQWKREG